MKKVVTAISAFKSKKDVKQTNITTAFAGLFGVSLSELAQRYGTIIPPFVEEIISFLEINGTFFLAGICRVW